MEKNELDLKKETEAIECRNTLSIGSTDYKLAKTKLEELKLMSTTIKEALVPGKNGMGDYGLIDGCGKKPSLFKAGAEKICLLFGLVPKMELVEKSDDCSFALVKCSLYKPIFRLNGEYVTEILVSESYGSHYEKIDPNRPGFTKNRVIQMAQKRAYVSATVRVGNLSNVFTHSMEDSIPVAETKEKIMALWRDPNTDQKAFKLVLANILENNCKDYNLVGPKEYQLLLNRREEWTKNG